jgi:hypothetical protein
VRVHAAETQDVDISSRQAWHHHTHVQRPSRPIH